jgi:hypothetical protein
MMQGDEALKASLLLFLEALNISSLYRCYCLLSISRFIAVTFLKRIFA